jgi:hypothetical protein
MKILGANHFPRASCARNGAFGKAKPMGLPGERQLNAFRGPALNSPTRTANTQAQSATPFTLAHPMGEVVPVTRCNKRVLARSPLASDLRFNG